MIESKRGRIDRLGWRHKDIPVATCIVCNHNIYSDEEYERHSFADSSGNTDREYNHKTCPTHEIVDVEIITRKRCTECGVTFEDSEIL